MNIITPDWPAPANIRYACTTRQGGVSASPYESFNLADHVNDDPSCVKENRVRLSLELQLPSEPMWLHQVHGSRVVNVNGLTNQNTGEIPEADATCTRLPGVVCAVLTADCLPVLLCNRSGSVVAAAHAGWRGLVAGVLESTVKAMAEEAGELIAWLGPTIGPRAYEVDTAVYQQLSGSNPVFRTAFKATSAGHWQVDLAELARRRLKRSGVEQVYGGNSCTFEQGELFYSYRRDGVTGRMASLIWIDS